MLQDTTGQAASAVYSDYKSRWSIETYNNYVKNDADFNDLKNQDYYCAHGFDFIMLVTGLIHSRLNEAVKSMGKNSISTIDMLIKAGHMRMVKHDDPEYVLCVQPRTPEERKSADFVICLPETNVVSANARSGKKIIFANTADP